ncbi:hypothetical protein [Halorussus pelagicus]|uniref:hypothetical protein n=1 Tax=Halorussus pelagicus TaxID=2505977 RepID=UPI00140E2FE5|nr:hypothetical protein [Halorussus pelagicus]
MSKDKNRCSMRRRNVLKAGAGLLVGGTSVLGSASAKLSDSVKAAKVRGTLSDPITRGALEDAVDELLEDVDAEFSESRRQQLRQHDVSETGDIVAFNAVVNNGKPSVYYGIRGKDEETSSLSTSSTDDTDLFRKADAHLEAKKQESNPQFSTMSSEFTQISDKRLDYESNEIAPSNVQFRIYENEWNNNSDVMVYQTRVDQRLADYIDDAWKGQIENARMTHDWNKSNGAKLEDWSPAGAEEQSGSGTATVSIGPSGPSASYTYDFKQEEVTVEDESPFEEETAEAFIDVPQSDASVACDRYRAYNASIGLLDEFTYSGSLPTPHIWTEFHGAFMYPENCNDGSGLCPMAEESVDLSYNFAQGI